MSKSGSKIREQVAHFLVDIHIVDKIPEGQVLVGNKTGDLVGIQHDVGIFELPNHDRYVIAVFTGNLQNDMDGIATIGKISATMYESMK